jgi:hypothetical protein
VRAVAVPPAKIGAAWPHVAEWVSEALIKGNADKSPEDIRQHLDHGSMQLWLAWDRKPVGVCVTELIDSVRGRSCNIVVVAGERFDAWAHLQDDIERWAAEHWGCVRLSLIGRKGWARRLVGAGWTETAVTLERTIGGRE